MIVHGENIKIKKIVMVSNDSREEVAHKVAWSAVKTQYERGIDSKWHQKKN